MRTIGIMKMRMSRRNVVSRLKGATVFPLQ